VYIYGYCPECGNAIETIAQQDYPSARWDGAVISDIPLSGTSSGKRRIGGPVVLFKCPSCYSDLLAAVQVYGKRSKGFDFGESTCVWSIESRANDDARRGGVRTLRSVLENGVNTQGDLERLKTSHFDHDETTVP
jgi:predicted RNA-binding Zn-ribbon protein involved in translation (DUF1610 family)